MRTPNPNIDPAVSLGDWERESSTGTDAWTHYTCKLVTPLYGGGVRAGEVDEAMPIRASGIRGQLRFWWRIGCGPFPIEAMFQREAAIWGGIASTGPSASKVAVRIDNITGLGRPAFTYQPNQNQPGELRTMPDAADWVDPTRCSRRVAS